MRQDSTVSLPGTGQLTRPRAARRARRLISRGLGALALAVCAPAATPAQQFERIGMQEGRLSAPLREGLPETRGGFTLCRLLYSSVVREQGGLGWSTDYPMGDQNLLVRLSQLTTTHVSIWNDGVPGHAVVRPTDPELFQCPFLLASDIGTAAFSDAEAGRLREYLLKGGFLWADDFWGERALSRFTYELSRILPGLEVEVIGSDHPIFSILYVLDGVPQIPNLQFWTRSGGETSERGAETRDATLRGVFDHDGRLLVVMTHNTDIADGWEREGDSNEFFRLFSPGAYGLAVNILLWMMTR